MAITELTRDQRVQLFNALLAAFPGWNELKEMVDLQLGRNLEEISASSHNIRTVALALIVWAQAGGYLGELTSGALAAKPDNPQLKAFAAMMASASGAAARVEPPTSTPAANKEVYERLIWKAVAFAGTAEFRTAMAEREGRVCRVEYPEGFGQGTGFLVGPDLLFTNYHVLEDFIEKRQPPVAVACRFDYQANADGTKVNDGRVVKLAASDWLVRSSPIKELDFALVRLAERAGDDQMPGGGTRGRLTATPHAFEVGEAVFVLQHPKAAPLKIAAGGVAKVEERRIHYLANTLNGSSGSPCFTSDWQLAALHRGGDDIANIAIPFSAILADLQNEPAFRLE
jgi:V8-like Glu-specific endopeptidase